MCIWHQVVTKGFLLNPWGSDVMTSVPEHLEKVVPLAKGAQIIQLVKDNQLFTAVILFVLWQAGAVAQAAEYAGCA